MSTPLIGNRGAMLQGVARFSGRVIVSAVALAFTLAFVALLGVYARLVWRALMYGWTLAG